VVNQVTGDDFVLFVKEAMLPTGERRPFSVWLSGSYPRSLDGLCKSLSLDLRVVTVAWGMRKLRQLLDCAETRGEFMAPVPGKEEKRQWYPSTVAYLAELILHRLRMLNLTDEVHGEGVLSFVAEKAKREEAAQPTGLHCSACHAYAVRKIDGCLCCTSCGDSKCS
jgi:ribonucleoside-diphosphate reductase alpha chain